MDRKDIDELLKNAVESSAYLTHYLIETKHSQEWDEAESAMALVAIYMDDLSKIIEDVESIISAHNV